MRARKSSLAGISFGVHGRHSIDSEGPSPAAFAAARAADGCGEPDPRGDEHQEVDESSHPGQLAAVRRAVRTHDGDDRVPSSNSTMYPLIEGMAVSFS